MADLTQEEALAFIESMRLTVAGHVGFRWMTQKLATLAAYVDALGAENRRLNAYVDSKGLRAEFDASAPEGDDEPSDRSSE